ncbi:MAG: hypothetical protein IT385_01560 [Deltaproteobacteria bacterium]|nr:hypothetical protein [Deltaproteobacteria bacterium]
MRTWTWGAVVVGALGALAGTWGASGEARAEGCGNIGETGVCQDPKTLVYCARGELKTMTCAADEICVPHEFYGGSSGCVATRYAGCGDITAAGQCVGDALLLYCDNNRVAERVCAQGWTCGLVADEDDEPYYDCVAELDIAGTQPAADDPTPPVESDVEDDDDHVEQDPTSYPEVIAGPTVERGGAPAAGEYSAGGGACAGGGSGLGGIIGLLALGLARRSRR